MAENLVKQESYFTRREWVLRYSSPFKSLMFMAGPMIIIMIVNSLYGIIDKQLTLNFAVNEVAKAMSGTPVDGYPAIWSPNIMADLYPGAISQAVFAKQLINVSTQYSQTIVTILQALSLFTSVGTGIRFGQAMGARDKDRMNNVIISGFIQTCILIVIGTIVLSLVYPYILTSQAGITFVNRHTSWQFNLSDEYSRMFVYGFALLAMSNFFITLMRTEGKVWWVIGNNIFCVCINIMFGVIFMEKLEMGMKGAVFGSMMAWGTSITVSILVITFSKDSFLKPNFRRFVFSVHDALQIWAVGLSPLLVNIVFAVVSYVSTILITNLHDFSPIETAVTNWWNNGQKPVAIDSDIAKYLDNYMFVCIGDANNPGQTMIVSEHVSESLRIMSSANPWMTLVYAPIIGMSQGANVNYAYNIGANKRARIRQIYQIHLLINVCWLVFAEIMMFIFAPDMMELFCGPRDRANWFIMYLSPMIFASVTFTTISLFQGLGSPRDALIVSISRALLIQITFIILGWVMAKNLSDDGSKDWVMFLMNGLQEIPAFILAGIMLIMKFKSWTLAGINLDVEDNFAKPTLADVVAGEYLSQINKKELHMLERLREYKYFHPDDAQGYDALKAQLEKDFNKFKNIMLEQKELAVAKNSILEAHHQDTQNFKNAIFTGSLEVSAIKGAIVLFEQYITKFDERLAVWAQKIAAPNLSGEEQKEIARKIKAVEKEKHRVYRALAHAQIRLGKAEARFDTKKAYFEAHREQIVTRVTARDAKRVAKHERNIARQAENKVKYEKRLQENPNILALQERQKAKLKKQRDKDRALHDARTVKMEAVLQHRDERRRQRYLQRK